MHNLSPEQRLLFTLLVGSKPYNELEQKFGADTCASALKTNLMVKSFFGDTQITVKGHEKINQNTIKPAPKPLKPVTIQTPKTVKPRAKAQPKPKQPKPIKIQHDPNIPKTRKNKRALPHGQFKWVFSLEMERYLIATAPNQNAYQRADANKRLAAIWNIPVNIIRRKIQKLGFAHTRKHWTEKEEQALITAYLTTTKSFKTLSQMFNHPGEQIRKKLVLLEIHKPTLKEPPWTDGEVLYLKENAKKLSSITMAKRLAPRTPNAICAKCRQLNLTRGKYGKKKCDENPQTPSTSQNTSSVK